MEQPPTPPQDELNSPLNDLHDTQDNTTTEPADKQTEANDEKSGKSRRRRGGKSNASSEGEGQKVKQLETDLNKLTEELGEMKDKYLRLYAEFDNYRKRSNREMLEMQKSAAQSVLKALIPAVDDFDRAVKIAEMPDSQEILPTGIKLVFEKLTKTLESQGLSPMETNGAEFNADLHEAITKIPAPTAELKGKIIDTVERGYTLYDKIIRFPKVVVGE